MNSTLTFWLELAIMMALIFWGVRKGGLFLTLVGGIGVFIYTFVFKSAISDPPMTVLRIIFTVCMAAGAMQVAGGVDYLVGVAENILRKHPRFLTILAPVVAFVFVFCCGTGHIVWSLLPIINEIAIENGIRPERPIAATIVSSQNAVCATPLAAATAAMVGFMEEAGTITMVQLLAVVIPALLLGSIAAGVSMLKYGKELKDDPEYLARIADGRLVVSEHHENKLVDLSKFEKTAKLSVVIFLVSMLCIVLLGVFPTLRPVLSNEKQLGMTDVIQIFMFIAAVVILLTSKKDSNLVVKSQVFGAGVFACLVVVGLCWMVNIFVGANSAYLTEVVKGFLDKYPWIFIVACYLICNITTSQSSTTGIVVPIGLALGVSMPILVAGWATIGSHFLLPTASESLAAIPFDTAGTTKIGKYVINTSYLLPGIVMAIVDGVVAFLLGTLIF